MLAHELILDPNFSLKPTEKTPFAKQVEDIAKRAMVDTIKEQMKAGTYSSHLIAALSDIQKGLLGMVNEKGPIAHEIHQVFDFDYIKQQMDSKVFNLVKLVQYTGEKMLQLCAPIRDKSIREIGNEKDVVVAMFKLLDLIQEMKLDLANYRLQAIKPILTQQAVDYEKNKFNLAIFNGSLKLTKTKKWLEDTVKQMNAVKESRNPEMIQTQSKIKYSDVFNHALLGLLFSTKPIDPSLLPETLSIDAKRLFDFQNELQAMTIVSAITMLSKNIVVELRLEHQVMQELTKRLFAHLRSENTTLEVLVKEITDTCNILFHKQTKVVSNVSNLTSNPMQQRLKELSPEQIELITNMVSKTVSYKDPFFSVLNRRLEKLTRLALESTFRRNSLAKHGLDLIGGELESLMVKITLMAKHNKNVFGEHYDKILKSIV
ncbi:T-complex 11 [Globomyces pollinis-pini]|nr:T-complex 11 [Globomyces pollinis-pini]